MVQTSYVECSRLQEFLTFQVTLLLDYLGQNRLVSIRVTLLFADLRFEKESVLFRRNPKPLLPI